MWNPSSIPVPWLLAFYKENSENPFGLPWITKSLIESDFNLFQHFFSVLLWLWFWYSEHHFIALAGNSLLEFCSEHLVVTILPCPLITGHKLVLSIPAAVNYPLLVLRSACLCSWVTGNSPEGLTGLSWPAFLSLWDLNSSIILIEYLNQTRDSKVFSLSSGLVLHENLLFLEGEHF